MSFAYGAGFWLNILIERSMLIFYSMKKLPVFPFFAAPYVLLCLSLAVPSAAEARIGESREAIERRLFSAGAIIYRDDQIETNRRRSMPYMKYMDFMPESVELRIYFKAPDDRKPKSSQMEEKRMQPGWDLHVLYVRGKSVLEVYRRSQSMTEPELNLLLTALAEGCYWKKVSPDPNNKEALPTAFGYDMERSDSLVRGKKMGSNSLMVYDVNFDAGLAEMQIEDDLERAPGSVKGF